MRYLRRITSSASPTWDRFYSYVTRAHNYWDAQVARLPDWATLTGHLTIGLVLVNIITFIGLNTDHGWYNPYTAYLLTVTFLCLLFVMLYGTEGWSFRSVGVLFLVAGDLLIYGPIAAKLAANYEPNSRVRLSLARSFFVVGSVFALYGVQQWIRAKRANRPSNEGPTALTRKEIVD